MDFCVFALALQAFLEFDFALFYEFFNFEYRVLHSMASVREATLLDLFVDPSDNLW
jgi:hypothetical protein